MTESFGTPESRAFTAAFEGDIDVIDRYLANGGNLHCTCDEKGNLIRAAILGQQEDMVMHLMDLGAPLYPSVFPNQLFTAVWSPKVTKRLLAMGMSAVVVDRHNANPLFYCAKHGNGEVAKLLLDASADPENWHSEQDCDVATAAARHWNAGVLQALADYGMDLAQHRHRSCQAKSGYLLHDWADGETRSEDADLRMRDTFDVLMRAGSKLTDRDDDHHTALDLALIALNRGLYHAKLRISQIKLLIEHGADPTFKDYSGLTPLSRAARYIALPVLEMFDERGVDLQMLGQSGRTLLHEIGSVQYPEHLAQAKDYRKTVDYLIDRGLDINARDIDGNTPLMLSIEFGHAWQVKVFLEAGADIHIVNDQDQNALDLCNAEDFRSKYPTVASEIRSTLASWKAHLTVRDILNKTVRTKVGKS